MAGQEQTSPVLGSLAPVRGSIRLIGLRVAVALLVAAPAALSARSGIAAWSKRPWLVAGEERLSMSQLVQLYFLQQINHFVLTN